MVHVFLNSHPESLWEAGQCTYADHWSIFSNNANVPTASWFIACLFLVHWDGYGVTPCRAEFAVLFGLYKGQVDFGQEEGEK